MNESDKERKAERAKEVLGRLKVIKINDLDELILLLARILSMIKNKQLNFKLKMIVIDSLSSLFCGIPMKGHQYFQMIKELMYYFKSFTKKHFISVIYTNNTKEGGATRVTELKNSIGEPLVWGVEK